MCRGRRREQCSAREQGRGHFTHPGGAIIRSGKNPHSDNIPKLEVFHIENLLSEAITKLITRGSLSDLFTPVGL